MNKILIVEDEPSLLEILTEKFRSEDFVVVQGHDGQEGLDQALKEKPDVILLDLLMPKMGGMEMLKRLRESGEWGKKVPVIILTNFNKDEKTAWGAANLNPANYLIKVEVGIDQIVQKVRALIK